MSCGGSAAPDRAHVVHFDEGEGLGQRVAEFLASSLSAQQAALVLASRDHHDAIATSLETWEVDASEAARRGRFVVLDSDRALDDLLVEGMPDAGRFEEIIGSRVRSLHRSFGGVRAYGELVDLLVRRHRLDAALALETLWGGLAERTPMSLMCGYGLDGFLAPLDVEAFRSVCAAHDRVVHRHGAPNAYAQTVAELELRTRALARESDARRRLEEAVQRSRDRLAVLAAASARFSEAKLDLDDVVRALADEVTRHIATSCVVLLRCQDDASCLDVSAVRHARPELEQLIRGAGPRARVPLDGGLVGRVLQASEGLLLGPLDVDPARRDDLLPDFLAIDRAPIGSLVVVPLRASGVVLGILLAAREPAEPPLSEDDRVLLGEIADRAALAVECALTYRMADTANRAKDDFLAVLGHELRNPLSPIVTALELMKLRGAMTVERERHMIERQVRSMVRLVDDLLDVSRITRGKVQLSRHIVETSSVVTRAIEMASPMLEARRHHLDVSVANEGLPVDVDEGRMAQVLANLLINAAKYTERGGHIAIAAEAEDGTVSVCVRDDGIGIAPEVVPKLFDAFVQGERRSEHASGGLGIGLTIARSLVELHGGTIAAFSEGLGRGSAFTVRMPAPPFDIDSMPTHVDDATGSRGAHASPSVRRILLVDDNRDAADALGEALRDLGHCVEVAYDGPTALAIAARFRPDTALLDIGLPAMDGYELAGRLRATPSLRLRRLVALTGYGQEADRRRAQSAGFDAHLVKPVPLSSILEMLDASRVVA